MAVNLIPSNDITITQTDNDITLNVRKDSSVSTSSTKPVENQAITNYVNEKSLEVYSETETIVGRWVDGKPLYRKVFIIPTTNDMNLEYLHGLTNLDKYYINNGVSILFGNNESLPVNWYWTSSDYARCWMNSTKLRWRCPANVGNRTLYLVVEYTKTTD